MFQVRLKELREKAGYTQETLAEILHVSQSTVGMWENGKNKPKNARLEALANLFNVTTDYLLGREETGKKSPPPTPEDELDNELLTLIQQLPPEKKKNLVEFLQQR